MKCIFCDSEVPVGQHKDDVVFCTGCGKPYRCSEVTEIWFDTYWHKHQPIEDKE